MSAAVGETAATALLSAPTPRPTPKPHAAYGAHHAPSVDQEADVVIFALTIALALSLYSESQILIF